MDQVAERLGVSKADATKGVAAALPALLGGLQANASDPKGEASLKKALQAKDESLVKGGIDLGDVDVADGVKIVKNIFGSKTPEVEQRLGAVASNKDDMMGQLLPILAPIVLSFIVSKMGGDKGGSSSGGGLGDLLGGLLGGSGGGSNSGGDLLGSVLGSVLSGSSGNSSGSSGGGLAGGLGDLLGGLLGGGKR